MAEPRYVTLDELDLFGDMDSLPFSLDDPIWQDREAAMAFLAKKQADASDASKTGTVGSSNG